MAITVTVTAAVPLRDQRNKPLAAETVIVTLRYPCTLPMTASQDLCTDCVCRCALPRQSVKICIFTGYTDVPHPDSQSRPVHSIH